MSDFLIIIAGIVVYIFGGGFTCGLLKPDYGYSGDEGFWCFLLWCFLLWWLILPCLAVIGGVSLLGWCGYKVALFLRGFFA